MKRIIQILFLTSAALYCQSSITYDAGSSLDISAGADVCADNIVMNGSFTGTGTFCNNPLDVKDESSAVPKEFSLSQNYPNPFNPATIISFGIAKRSLVLLKVYNNLGMEITTIIDEEKPAGFYQIKWTPKDLASGVYFYELKADDFVSCKKMLLLK